MISFTNTEIAFAHLTNKGLLRAKFIFKLVSKPFFMKTWQLLLRVLLRLKIPVEWIAKPLIYNHFVGGDTLEQCKPWIERLWNFRVYSLLFYSVEREKNPENILSNYKELHNAVKFSIDDPRIAFFDFKPTGLIDSRILSLVSEKAMLNAKDEKEFDEFKSRVDSLCKLAYSGNKPIIIDAEESWYQNAVEELADEMMLKYNKEKAIVYRSFQLYRTNMLEKLFQSHRTALENNYVLGAKIVRGAYMDSERARAVRLGYKSPIFEQKTETDRAFNEAVKFSLSNVDSISIHYGTHNEDSIMYAISLMESLNIAKNDDRVFFSQLFGMSDNISFNLADSGYQVVKYIPYGPLLEVIPYLMRRSMENLSVQGQTGRELGYVKKEIKRRKFKKGS